jgi:hypothetical protein
MKPNYPGLRLALPEFSESGKGIQPSRLHFSDFSRKGSPNPKGGFVKADGRFVSKSKGLHGPANIGGSHPIPVRRRKTSLSAQVSQKKVHFCALILSLPHVQSST